MAETNNKSSWTQISTADWLKIAGVILAAAFALYRCSLPFRAEFAFREAYNYEAQRNFAAAGQKYEKVLRLAPWETYYHSQLGRIYENEARAALSTDIPLAEKLAKIQKADAVYDLCLKISPTNPWYVMRKAEMYGLYAELETDAEKKQALLGQREELILRASELDPNNAIFTLTAANLYLSKGEHAKALETYQHVLTIDERMGDAYMMLAELYRQQGDRAAQEEMYRTCIAKVPDYKNVRLQLGLLYEQQGRLKDAIVLYREEVQLDKNNEYAFRLLGSAFFRDSQWVNMEIAFNRLTIINPKVADYYLYKAQAQARQNKIQEAIVSLEAALTLRPDDASIKANLQNLRGY
ncbi:MAG: tetratricopeptide repeat protein [Candidatus Margulisbacteria bacterium]|jgi:tetratricopeptide (TPR) repeat protein|nr:tetratricopeptide repeat protein [Candidatus Margulisiibacteriota bacterium]